MNAELKMIRRRVYDADKTERCIYCSSNEEKLTTEHIIPNGIGGTLELLAASCGKCAKETNAFETRYMQSINPVRRKLKLSTAYRGKKDKERRAKETSIANIDGQEVRVPVPEFPAYLLSMIFPIPGILINEPLIDMPFTGGVYSIDTLPEFGIKLNNLKSRHKANKINLNTGMSVEDFGRVLAKIAHSYTVAEIGRDNFRPFLLNIIANLSPFYLGHYVGSAPYNNSDVGHDLHEIEIDKTGIGKENQIIVKIRLFALRNTPTYYVVAGEYI